MATVVVLGMVVGLQTVRESVVEELGDVANALGNINQSYSWLASRDTIQAQPVAF
jgi:hypothetical protein